jgi:hypothetical protein
MTDIRWHVAKWHLLAWAEMLVKLLGAGLAIYALARPPVRAAAWNTGSVVGVLILGLLSIGILLSIWDRLRRREIVSMVFAPINCVGHGAALANAVLSRGIVPSVATFAAVMLAGDLIRIAFIRRTGFTADGVSRGQLIGLAAIYVIGYAAVFGLSAASGI